MKLNILGADAIEWLGVHDMTILKAADTGGAISVLDSVSPAGSGPPRHIRHAADEAFLVLAGDARFWLEGAECTLGTAERKLIPRGREHTICLVSASPCRHLITLTPGGFEGSSMKWPVAASAFPRTCRPSTNVRTATS